MTNEDENKMAVIDVHLTLDAFKEMKKLLQEEMRSQGLTTDDIKKEIELERNG
ncbi:hypothetical protein [Peribacillus cavernae]|uniref:hypothetical protein n=1 Tax=Peribacillus cavernae TaxID=1674310 RepID=UPI00163D094E|nr:hypothetical protein [Peribacillus cavernae]MDQ0221338.1 hypothetical protein [Peribacillus cavernae]